MAGITRHYGKGGTQPYGRKSQNITANEGRGGGEAQTHGRVTRHYKGNPALMEGSHQTLQWKSSNHGRESPDNRVERGGWGVHGQSHQTLLRGCPFKGAHGQDTGKSYHILYSLRREHGIESPVTHSGGCNIILAAPALL